MNAKRRKLMVQSAVVGAPLLAYVAARVVMVPPPAVVESNVLPASTKTASLAAMEPLTPAQQAVLDWCRRTERASGLGSPFDHVIVDAVAPVVPEQEPEVTPVDEGPSPVAGLRLSSVLGTDGERMAMINGRLYRVGGVLPGELKVVAIDARNIRVSLQGKDGRVFVIGRQP